MTLKEMKIKTFSLIEEYYPDDSFLAEDEDVKNKINGVVNQIQMDLMKYRKINASADITIQEKDSKVISLKEEIDDLYQINNVRFEKDDIDYDMPDDNTIILPDDFVGTVTVYYFKYPTLVEVAFEDSTKETITQDRIDEDEDYEFELDPILLEIMPYGIAADLLKMDMISNYGRYFYERYQEMKQNIDPRRSKGTVKITGGADI